ncbi:MAG: glycosyl hydrolase 53 family protein [Clostridiales bacterium]|nr:glycosyl hydrolase 53 family protein [Clostridiales bacterium]
MNTKRFICVAICIVMLATSFVALAACNGENITTSDTLYAKKVRGLSKDFILGMDASSVISLENSGVKYYNFDGNEEDVFKILADNGINTIRVRVWNKPYSGSDPSTEKWFGGGNCDINTALAIGKRATQYGMGLMVDFHYSDFWADPNKQMAPVEWAGMDIDEKSEALYEYTKESLEKLKDAGVNVTLVQVGNETNGQLCGEKATSSWFNVAYLMANGCRAVKEVYPNALRVLHFTNPEKVDNYAEYASKLDYYKVDYDVFASSYYPYWHGTLENLSNVLGNIAKKYGKKVMVAETSYAFTDEDSDFYGNTIGAGQMQHYPFTVQGQANCVRDVIDTIAHTKNGIGVCYWEGTWISVGGSSWEENRALWEKYGSGWASSYSAAYDPGDAGKYYGGCAVDNQAFFDSTGHPLESLKIFGLIRQGNKIEVKTDAVEDTTLMCDLNGSINLPTKVNAIMTDDSRREIDVTWNITESDLTRMKNNGVAKYTFTGIAGGLTANIYISMVEFNFLSNYSFEDDSTKTEIPTGWNVTANKPADELYVIKNDNDALTGSNSFHFWTSSPNSINFDLEQELTNLEAGTYKFSISIMGGDGGTVNIYSYVKINGVIVYKMEGFGLNGWQNWDTKVLENIQYNGTDKIVVGIHVECTGSGGGAWGNIDDALFNSVA